MYVYIINPSPSLDLNDLTNRKNTLKSICDVSKAIFSNDFILYKEDKLKTVIEKAGTVKASLLYFLHARDIIPEHYITWNIPQNVFAVFYSGAGVSNLIEIHPQIQCLNVRFPKDIQIGKYRFNKIVQALRAVADGKNFRSVDINQPEIPPIFEIFTALDILIQGAIKLPEDTVLNLSDWFNTLSADITEKLRDCTKYEDFEKKHFHCLDNPGIKSNCKTYIFTNNTNNVSLFSLLKAISNNAFNATQNFPIDKNCLEQLHENYKGLYRILCASNK